MNTEFGLRNVTNEYSKQTDNKSTFYVVPFGISFENVQV